MSAGALLFGWLVLFLLTGSAAFAAVGVAVRSAPSGRAELGVIAALVFYALLATPVLVLGYTDHLTALPVGVVGFGGSAITWLASSRDGFRRHARETISAALALARLPFDGLAEAARARSAIVIGLLWSGGLVGLALFLTWLAPSESWDGFFYHEPIVGFAIQNHGFAAITLPQHQAVQATNGYARLGEAVSLWFVIFTDKTFIELPNTLAAPPLLLALYVMSRRTLDRLGAMAGVPVLLMIPALWTQMRSTYVDVEVGLYAVAAIHFATRPVYRVRDAVCATLAMALFVGAKLSGLAWVPPMALFVYGRLLWHHGRARIVASLATSACGSVVLACGAAVTLLHNWHAFHNPVWPMTLESSTFGVRWSGLNTVAELAPRVSLGDLVRTKYGAPIGGMPDIHDRDYGYALTWVVMPFTGIGIVRATLGAWSELRWGAPRVACNMMLVVGVGAFSLYATPSIFTGRYDVHIAAMAIVLACHALSGARWKRLREGVLVAGIALSIVPLYWTRGWYFGMNVDHISELLRRPASDRESMNGEDWDIPERVAKLRERELGPGDRVAFTQEILTPGTLWNFRFSNVVSMVAFENSTQFSAALAAFDPKWVVVADKGAARHALDQRAGTWEYVGPATTIDDGAIFRRKR